MASKAKTIVSTDSTQPGTAVEEREQLLHSAGEQEIRDRRRCSLAVRVIRKGSTRDTS